MNLSTDLSHRRVLRLALPLMAANLSTPLVGMVDTAVVGQLPQPELIGAVALGSMIFILLFWAFGFLRMGTTGLTAQAVGAGDALELRAGLLRALLVAAVAGAGLIGLQYPLRVTAFVLFDAPAAVAAGARDYFAIRIWAAPATFANYALLGWFVGRGRSGLALVLQLVLNMTNVVLDAVFVLVFGWGVSGVAAGTVLAECIAAATGLVLAWRTLESGVAWPARMRVFDMVRLRRMMVVNRDIMIRSIALITVFMWFVRAGAAQGAVVFAANAVLINFVSAGAYFLDGFAHTAETLVGQAVGRGDRRAFRAAVSLTTRWAAAIAVSISIAIALSGGDLIELMTVDSATRVAARTYLPWVTIAPLLGVWAFQLDGIFIGATRTAEMRRAMLWSLLLFFALWWAARPLANHGLWLALSGHYVLRALTLYRHYPALRRQAG